MSCPSARVLCRYTQTQSTKALCWQLHCIMHVRCYDLQVVDPIGQCL